MANKVSAYTGSNRLLVEGKTDLHVVLALRNAHKVPQNFGIYECGSDGLALKQLDALIISADPPGVLGVVIDADSPNLTGRWQSIKSILGEYKYDCPVEPEPTGTIIDSVMEQPRLGFWLMPNNRLDGMLEDFCIEMIDPSAIATVVQCLQIAEDNQCTSFKPVHRSKAIVHNLPRMARRAWETIGTIDHRTYPPSRNRNRKSIHELADGIVSLV